MCDEQTEQDIDNYLKRQKKLTRRDLGRLSATVGLTAMLPQIAKSSAGAPRLTESDVMIATPDGEADCYFVHPTDGKHAGVLIWPDILGLRPAFREMGRRLAESGYAVLVINPYYRNAPAPVVEPGASFRQPETREVVFPLASKLNAQTHFTDAKAFLDFLDSQSPVDGKRKMGTAGYCMGGPMVMRTAAIAPERVGAAATFHASRMVTDKEDSPHLLIPQTTAHVLHAIAENDDEKQPDAKTVLKKAYATAGIPAEIEVYKDTLHGWCPPDSAVYHQAQAERAWSRMVALFGRALS